MPRGGHNRKPSLLKIIQGTAQPCRMNPHEPQIKIESPLPSKHLAKQAKKEYRELIKIVDDMKIVGKGDRGELENLAIVRAQISFLQKKLFETKDPKAFRKIQLMINDAIRLSSALALKFGLTPADRSRVSVLTKESNNEWQNL